MAIETPQNFSPGGGRITALLLDRLSQPQPTQDPMGSIFERLLDMGAGAGGTEVTALEDIPLEGTSIQNLLGPSREPIGLNQRISR